MLATGLAGLHCMVITNDMISTLIVIHLGIGVGIMVRVVLGEKLQAYGVTDKTDEAIDPHLALYSLQVLIPNKASLVWPDQNAGIYTASD